MSESESVEQKLACIRLDAEAYISISAELVTDQLAALKYLASEALWLLGELKSAREDTERLREALIEIRIHLICEALPGAHRTGMPLDLVDEALGNRRGPQSSGEPVEKRSDE